MCFHALLNTVEYTNTLSVSLLFLLLLNTVDSLHEYPLDVSCVSCFTTTVVPPVVSLVTSHAGKEAVGLGVSGKQGPADVEQNDERNGVPTQSCKPLILLSCFIDCCRCFPCHCFLLPLRSLATAFSATAFSCTCFLCHCFLLPMLSLPLLSLSLLSLSLLSLAAVRFFRWASCWHGTV